MCFQNPKNLVEVFVMWYIAFTNYHGVKRGFRFGVWALPGRGAAPRRLRHRPISE